MNKIANSSMVNWPYFSLCVCCLKMVHMDRQCFVGHFDASATPWKRLDQPYILGQAAEKKNRMERNMILKNQNQTIANSDIFFIFIVFSVVQEPCTRSLIAWGSNIQSQICFHVMKHQVDFISWLQALN